MSTDSRTQVTVAWIAVVGGIVSALGAIGVALVTNWDRSEPKAPTNDKAIQDRSTTPLPPPPPPPPSINITGIWSDAIGTTYTIEQVGEGYTYEAANQYATAQGRGSIKDGILNGTYEIFYAGKICRGEADGRVLPGGQTITGKISDPCLGLKSLTINRQ